MSDIQADSSATTGTEPQPAAELAANQVSQEQQQQQQAPPPPLRPVAEEPAVQPLASTRASRKRSRLEADDSQPPAAAEEQPPVAAAAAAVAAEAVVVVNPDEDEEKRPPAQRRRHAESGGDPQPAEVQVIDLEALSDSDDDEVQVIYWKPAPPRPPPPAAPPIAPEQVVRNQFAHFLDRMNMMGAGGGGGRRASRFRPQQPPPPAAAAAADSLSVVRQPIDLVELAQPDTSGNAAADYFAQAEADAGNGDDADKNGPGLKFECGICQEYTKELGTTLCGHVYCWDCLNTAVETLKRCPTCRKTLTPRQIHRIYL